MPQKVIPPKIPLSHVRKISNTCSFALQLPRQTLKNEHSPVSDSTVGT